MDDESAAKLISAYPWAVLISSPDERGELVVSHLPVLQDPTSKTPLLLGHLAADDAQIHALGSRRVVVVMQGPHGYISPSWYQSGPFVPTWNFAVVHLHGRPEVLDGRETFQILDDTCAHMERIRTPTWQLETVRDYADRLAPYTTGFRLRPDRVVAKAKMSQDKSPEIVDRVIAALRSDPYHADANLAVAMAAARTLKSGGPLSAVSDR